ncbi:enoyl-CoA hydratase-related protein [Streptomyces sp. L7]
MRERLADPAGRAPDVPARGTGAPAVITSHHSPVAVRLEAPLAHVSLRDAAHGNRITPAARTALPAALAEAAADPGTRVIVLSGLPEIFCSGGTREDLTADGEARTPAGWDFVRAAADCPLPVVAAVQGHAIGGGLLLALYADAVVLSDRSSYAANFLTYGFTPCLGATHVLPAVLGQALGTEMLYTGRPYRGRELLARGACGEHRRARQGPLPRGRRRRADRPGPPYDAATAQAGTRRTGTGDGAGGPGAGTRPPHRHPRRSEARRRIGTLYPLTIPGHRTQEARRDHRALLFPGQGTQRIGMGKDLFTGFPDLTELAEDILGYSLRRLCLEDPDGVLGHPVHSARRLHRQRPRPPSAPPRRRGPRGRAARPQPGRVQRLEPPGCSTSPPGCDSSPNAPG